MAFTPILGGRLHGFRQVLDVRFGGAGGRKVCEGFGQRRCRGKLQRRFIMEGHLLDAEPCAVTGAFIFGIRIRAARDVVRDGQFDISIRATAIGRAQADPARLVTRDFGLGEDAGRATLSDGIVVRDQSQVGAAAADHPDADVIRVHLEAG